MNAIMLPFVSQPDRMVRVIRDGEHQVGFVAIDVARTLGARRQLVYDLVQRNPELFRKRAFFVPVGVRAVRTPTARIPGRKLPSGRSGEHLLVLTTEGVIAVALKTSEKEIHHPQARELVAKFQDWAISLIGCLLTGKPPEDPTVALFPPEMLRGRKGAALVKSIAAFRGCSLAQARRIVRKYKIAAGVPVRQAPPSAHAPRRDRWRDDVTPRWRAVREGMLPSTSN